MTPAEQTTEIDHIDADARRLCAAHQEASPTRQPCAACTQTAAERAQIPPIADGERIWVAGEPVWVRYDPDLMVSGTPRWGCSDWEPTGLNSVEVKPYGALQEVAHVQAGLRRVIRLRRWDERVFLHEVLHILLGKHYPNGHHAYDHTFVEDPKHENAVREIEDGLWDMGWRLFDGRSHIDPSRGPRVPGVVTSSEQHPTATEGGEQSGGGL